MGPTPIARFIAYVFSTLRTVLSLRTILISEAEAYHRLVQWIKPGEVPSHDQRSLLVGQEIALGLK